MFGISLPASTRKSVYTSRRVGPLWEIIPRPGFINKGSNIHSLRLSQAAPEFNRKLTFSTYPPFLFVPVALTQTVVQLWDRGEPLPSSSTENNKNYKNWSFIMRNNASKDCLIRFILTQLTLTHLPSSARKKGLGKVTFSLHSAWLLSMDAPQPI